eukprot:3928335-Karenia_brevis.AAC.1
MSESLGSNFCHGHQSLTIMHLETYVHVSWWCLEPWKCHEITQAWCKLYRRVDDDITSWCGLWGSPPCWQNCDHAGFPELCRCSDHEGGNNLDALSITSAPGM